MKRRIFIAISFMFGLLACITGCSTWAEKRAVDAKIESIHGKIDVGDDIHEARDRLIGEGFRVSEVGFTTTSKKYLSCVVKLNDLDSLDGLEYAMGKNLRPWRNGIHSHMIIRAEPDGTITSIDPQ